MPIYEFKCLKCNEYMEILVLGNSDDTVAMACSQCGAHELERIISASNFNMATSSGAVRSGPSTQSRSCSGGSCTTWNLPGNDR